MKKDYYQILEVDKNATEEDIKKSYKRLAKKYHPDLNKEAGADNKFKDINEAYQVLGDSQKRQNYDQFGSSEFDGSGGGGSRGFEGMNPFDIFNQFFSQQDNQSDDDGFFSMFSSGRRRERSSNLKTITITFLQSIQGCKYSFTYKSKLICLECKGNKTYQGDSRYIDNCSACNGKGFEYIKTKSFLGVVEGKYQCRTCGGFGKKITKYCKNCKGYGYITDNKTVEVKIPGGVKNGDQLIFHDEGSFDNQKIGILVNVKNSSIFTIEDGKLYTKAIIHPFIAVLGGIIEIPTPSGIKSIKINSGTKCGELLKLKGEGIAWDKRGTGDLYIKVEFAELKLSSKEIEILKSIKIDELREVKDWINLSKKELNDD